MTDPTSGAGPVVRERIPTAPGVPYPMGRHLVHDPRSKAYRADVAAVEPRRIVHPHKGPGLNQGSLHDQGFPVDGPDSLASCTGNSSAAVMNCAPLRRPGERARDQRWAIDVYAAATAIDRWAGTYPPDDTGSSGLAVAQVLTARGDIDRYEWGFGVQDTVRLAALSPLSVGSVWTEGMLEPDLEGFIRPTGDRVGGHQWTIRGVNPARSRILLLNSWGPAWGGWMERGRRVFAGHARLAFADLETLLDWGGDVVRYIRAPLPPPAGPA